MCWRKSTLAMIILLLSGCSAIGPGTVTRDRFDYNTAVSDSWKEQTLLNIIKIRYADMPLFMEVASIVSGYSLESSVNLGGNIVESGTLGSMMSLGTAGKFTDRPTITYAPITGAKFNKNFMTPVPPSAVLFMVQAGWPADIVLPITVEAINGLRSQKSTGGGQRAGDPRYYRMVELFKKIQQAGALGVSVIVGKKEGESLVMVIRKDNLPEEIIATGKELADLLGLRREAAEYKVTYGEIASNDTELAIQTRSMMSIMIEFAGQASVPEAHIAEGRTVSGRPGGNLESTDHQNSHRLIDIKVSKDEPRDAFIAVQYKDYWFWIDDRDFKSKRTFAYLMILFSITETGGRESLPLITIPAG